MHLRPLPLPTVAISPREFDLVAAPFTPMRSDGSLNLAEIEPYAKKLHADGVTGVFVCGTTGEGMSLTEKERREVAATWKSAVNGSMRLIVHVGHPALGDAQSLARHAEQIAVDGIAAIGPIFFAPSSPEALVALNRDIAAAAPSTPFYSYHMPSMSRVSFLASSNFLQTAEAIPTFRGIKFTHEDLNDYRRCLDLAGDRYEVLFGRDEILLDALEVGAKGAVGSTYNFASPLYRQIWRSYQAGDHDEARRLQTLCWDAVKIIVRYGGLSAIKVLMPRFGVDCGPMRLPQEAVGRERLRALEAELDSLGFFEAISDWGTVATI